MRTRHLRGTTAQLNSLTLPEGRLAIDLEKKALRLYDGATPGGFEMLGSPIEVPLPGSQTLVGGDETAGFYGEVPSAEFISGGDLATAIGLSGGILHNDTTPWLKFSLDGQILYIPKKTLRRGLSWDVIYQAGAVYGTPGEVGSNPTGTATDQNAQVVIGDKTYRVRLLRGANTDPTVQGADAAWTGWDIDLSHGSEWNRLMYPVHSGIHTDANNPSSPSVPYAQWASYSDADLGIHLDTDSSNGIVTWCQETAGDDTARRIALGYYGVTNLSHNASSFDNYPYGWRPVLIPIT